MKSTIEILLKKDVQKIFDKFSLCFNIRIVFFTPDGRELAVGLNKPANELCRLMKKKLHKEKLCTCFDREILHKALTKMDMVTEYCYAGMIESIVPIFYQNIHLGYCKLGQYRSENTLNNEIITEWKEKIGSPEKLIIAYLKTPSFSKEQIANIQSLFYVIVDYIVSQNMITVKRNMTLEKIITFINNNVEKNITLKDVSHYVYKSASTISHLFSSLLKKSFKQYVIELKLKKAEEYLLNEPGITIIEVANKLGYDDPYYFSRLFKKYKGLSPTAFLKKMYTNYSRDTDNS
jgi:AraC-like DNA-binding protein